jgi:O-antigen/teichoic acid export membrane protein
VNRQLARRAALTFLSNVMQQGARLLVQFVVTPVLIRGLGVPLYGAWVMMQQVVGYMGLGDVRPMSTLKFALAVRQHVNDVEEKKRMIGAAVRLTLLTTPFVLLIGAALTWFSPSFIRLPVEYTNALRAAMTVMVLQFTLDRLLSLPSNVLVGMNLDYRSMGMSTASVLLSGFLTWTAVRLGLGLPGVAGAVALAAIVHAAGRYMAARRALSWLAISRPSRDELKAFAKMSGWVTISGLGNLMIASDILLVGIVADPRSAAVYAATAAMMRFLVMPLGEVVTSGTAGIVGLCGSGEWHRVARIRAELAVLTTVLMTVTGCVIIMLNQHFLPLWTKHDVYGGHVVNLLIVTSTFLMMLYRAERVIVTGLMEFRQQSVTPTLAAVFALGSGALLMPYIGLAGVPGALTVAYAALVLQFGAIIRARTGGAMHGHFRTMLRPLSVAALLFTGAVLLADRLHPDGWIELGLAAAAIAACALAVMLVAGLSSSGRGFVISRFARLAARIRTRITGR